MDAEFPEPESATETDDFADLQRCATGQKLIIYAILANVATYFVRIALLTVSSGSLLYVAWLAIGAVLNLVALAAIVLSIIGVLRIGKAFAYSAWIQAMWCVFLFVPLTNLLVLLYVKSQATVALRDAGYRVGFLGVRGPLSRVTSAST
jgi:hypothetical protein